MDDGTGDPDRAPPVDLSSLVEAVETDLLGGPQLYDRAELTKHAGVQLDEAQRLWRALGFASVGDDVRVFTDADVTALQNVARLRALGEIDDDLMQSMTRMIGQTFARLASWQGQVIVELIGRRPELVVGGDQARLRELIDQVLPVVSELHEYVWRRQLAAFFSRVASNSGVRAGATTEMAVGFVDMAGFTTLTRRSSEAELRDVLTAFESLATEIVGGHRGQIVKTIGDEVLFVADEPVAAAQIALDLVDAAEGDDLLPDVRGGVAWGGVVGRLGDVYGQTVNIASRLTSIARPASVLADDNLAERLRDEPSLRLHSLRPTTVRGYRHLHSWRLRRAEAA